MAEKNWEESLKSLGAKLDELSAKANEAAETAKAAQQEKKEELDAKPGTREAILLLFRSGFVRRTSAVRASCSARRSKPA